jgi:hypothetical protein
VEERERNMAVGQKRCIAYQKLISFIATDVRNLSLSSGLMSDHFHILDGGNIRGLHCSNVLKRTVL